MTCPASSPGSTTSPDSGVTAILAVRRFFTVADEGIFGYDWPDYRTVESMFGSDLRADRLIEAAPLRAASRLMMGHDSLPHCLTTGTPGSRRAAAGRDNPEGRLGFRSGPIPGATARRRPTGLSILRGPAWTFDPRRGQYYWHCFS